MLFHRTADRAVLSGGSAVIDGEEQPPGDVTLYRDRIELENGDVFPLEDVESVEGTLTDIHARREAMGSEMCIRDRLGIAQAVVSRMGFGKNLPFGPALLSAAFIWLLGGDRWWFLYIRFISGE